MSISTKTGDDGSTSLYFGRRVPKTHPRIEVCGAFDEFTAYLGLGRAHLNQSNHQELREWAGKIEVIQQDLIFLMGEISTLSEDREKYLQKGKRFLGEPDVERISEWVRELESRDLYAAGWAVLGRCMESAHLDVARVSCRRAERMLCGIPEITSANTSLIPYVNRLSDFLWLLARLVEKLDER
jgi:cob(I)alamin adenosyltransferase